MAARIHYLFVRLGLGIRRTGWLLGVNKMGNVVAKSLYGPQKSCSTRTGFTDPFSDDDGSVSTFGQQVYQPRISDEDESLLVAHVLDVKLQLAEVLSQVDQNTMVQMRASEQASALIARIGEVTREREEAKAKLRQVEAKLQETRQTLELKEDLLFALKGEEAAEEVKVGAEKGKGQGEGAGMGAEKGGLGSHMLPFREDEDDSSDDGGSWSVSSDLSESLSPPSLKSARTKDTVHSDASCPQSVSEGGGSKTGSVSDSRIRALQQRAEVRLSIFSRSDSPEAVGGSGGHVWRDTYRHPSFCESASESEYDHRTITSCGDPERVEDALSYQDDFAVSWDRDRIDCDNEYSNAQERCVVPAVEAVFHKYEGDTAAAGRSQEDGKDQDDNLSRDGGTVDTLDSIVLDDLLWPAEEVQHELRSERKKKRRESFREKVGEALSSSGAI